MGLYESKLQKKLNKLKQKLSLLGSTVVEENDFSIVTKDMRYKNIRDLYKINSRGEIIRIELNKDKSDTYAIFKYFIMIRKDNELQLYTQPSNKNLGAQIKIAQLQLPSDYENRVIIVVAASSPDTANIVLINYKGKMAVLEDIDIQKVKLPYLERLVDTYQIMCDAKSNLYRVNIGKVDEELEHLEIYKDKIGT